MTTYNVTERVLRYSAQVLGVPLHSTAQQVTDRLGELTGQDPTTALTHGSTDPHTARHIAAAQVLLAGDRERSRAVVRFLSTDAALPETDRMVPPVPQEPTVGYQPALLAS